MSMLILLVPCTFGFFTFLDALGTPGLAALSTVTALPNLAPGLNGAASIDDLEPPFTAGAPLPMLGKPEADRGSNSDTELLSSEKYEAGSAGRELAASSRLLGACISRTVGCPPNTEDVGSTL